MVVEEKSYIAVEQLQEQLSEMEVSSQNIGQNLRSALLKANSESRAIVGISSAVKCLSEAPEDSLFCIMALPQKGDTATHMHEVLLQAFCFENDIYIIQVDSSEKLSRLLNSPTTESCVLIQRSYSQEHEEVMTEAENSLVDHCEDYWDAPKQPVIKLPVK